MKMIKLVGILALIHSLSASALVPVEGILMGEANQDYQLDPLNYIFKDVIPKGQEGEKTKLKKYYSSFTTSEALEHTCEILKPSTYPTPRAETQAKRSVVSSLQYLGLDLTIKAIGAYAKKLEIGSEDYNRLSKNLVTNYCSKNLTVMSVRNVEKSLAHYYQHPEEGIIPSVKDSPFATALYKKHTDSSEARSKEFEEVIRNFRAFCSWGGSVEDYRLLGPYLKNPVIMSTVIRHMLGSEGSNSIKVVCDDQICRPRSDFDFNKLYPLSTGSTGLSTDLAKLYCHDFRYKDYSSKNPVPQVATWVKGKDPEEPILETSQFIALLTGVPDLFVGATKYNSIPVIVRSSLDERWDGWAKEVLSTFSKGLLFEESIKVRAIPRRDIATLQVHGFEMDFMVTLGEMDRIMNKTDKVDVSFDLKMSKNYIRSLRTKWDYLTRTVNVEEQEAFKKEIATYIEHHLKPKEKLFNQKMWNDTFSKLIADELLAQALAYRGPLFNSLKDEMLTVPVKFSYGLFALGYLRYRADVTNGRLKINL